MSEMQKLKVIMHMNTSAMRSIRCVCTYILNECTTSVGSQNYALRLTEQNIKGVVWILI